MIMRTIMIISILIICLVCCCKPLKEAKRVSKNFAKEYTGIDTLIKVNGYYYREDNTGLRLPIVFSKYSEFQMFRYGNFKTHEELQNAISRLEPCKGNYAIVGDTIKVEWTEYYELWSHSIYVNHYLIVNDTTLRQIWYSCKTCKDSKYDTDENHDYHFVKY